MVQKKRRTLHQVFCDTNLLPRYHNFIYHEGKFLRKVNFLHETDYNIIYEEFLENSSIGFKMDVDFLAENCYEVFNDELKILTVLYGK